MMKRRIQTIAVVLALCLGLPRADAAIMQVDGYAQMGIVLISPDRIVCCKSASGQKQAELFCLETKTQQVVWRLSLAEPIWNGTAVGSNAFYHITGDVLFKRSLNTGEVIWQTPLASIPAQKSPPSPTVGENAEAHRDQMNGTSGHSFSGPTPILPSSRRAGRTPDSYVYCGPFASGPNLVLCREAWKVYGSMSMNCFDDWLVIDPVRGRHLGGGDGPLLGTLDGTCLIGGPNPRIVRNAAPERFMEFERLQNDSTESSFWGFDRANQCESGDHCLVTARSGNKEVALLIGKSGHQITTLAATDKADYQCEWVLLKDRILRFAQCLQSTNEGLPNKDFKLWFELYGLDGKLERTVEWSGTGVDAKSYWSSFGLTPHNDLVIESGNEIFVIATPDFRVTSHYTPPSPARFPLNSSRETPLRFVSGSDDLYQVWGSVSLLKMEQAELSLPVGIRLLNVHTGKPVWEYSEMITIQKITR